MKCSLLSFNGRATTLPTLHPALIGYFRFFHCNSWFILNPNTHTKKQPEDLKTDFQNMQLSKLNLTYSLNIKNVLCFSNNLEFWVVVVVGVAFDYMLKPLAVQKKNISIQIVSEILIFLMIHIQHFVSRHGKIFCLILIIYFVSTFSRLSLIVTWPFLPVLITVCH